MKRNLSGFKGLSVTVILIVFSSCLMRTQAQDLDPAAWPHLKGYWKFQNAGKPTKATVGKDLVLTGTHQVVNGPAYGDTAIRIAIGSYYTCAHGMAPNGGGDSVNQYTLMFDFRVLSFRKWHTFFKTDSNNNNDGECFIRPLSGSKPGCIGVGATGYSVDSINPKQWYRLMISVNLGYHYRYYLNGTLLHEGDTQDIDGRFALTPKMIFFGDDNQEDDTIDVASVAVFDTCLSAADIAKIGTIEPCIANPPKVDLGNDTSLCAYESTVKRVPGGFASYLWSTGSKLAFVNLTSKSPGMGQRKVWVKVVDRNGCVATDTVMVTFNVVPKINELGPPQFFCKGDTFATLIAGTDTTCKYEWREVGQTGVIHTGSIYVTDSNGYYIGTMINSLGCRNSDTVMINVYPKPDPPTISPAGPVVHICQGRIQAMTGPSGYAGYWWSNGVKQQTNYADKTEAFTLKVWNGNCYSLPSDTLFLKVHPLPPRPKLNMSGITGVCQGDSLILNTASGYKQYNWNDGVKYNTRAVKGTGQYYVVVTDSNNCVSGNSDTLTATVYPPPAKPILNIRGNVAICDGEQLVLSVIGGAYACKWSDGETGKYDTVTLNGSYRVKVASADNCYSEWSDATQVQVKPVPSKPVVIKSGVDSLQCSIAAQQYRWYGNGVVIPDNGQTIAFMPSGFYKVQAGNDGCWSAVSDSVYFRHSGVLKLMADNGKLLLYPNPAQNAISIKAELATEGQVPVSVYDIQGREVMHSFYVAGQLSTGATLDIQHLAAGFYHLKVMASGRIYTAVFEKH